MRVLRCVQKDIGRSTKIHYKLLLIRSVCVVPTNLPKACRMEVSRVELFGLVALAPRQGQVQKKAWRMAHTSVQRLAAHSP
jgi:hypothetical protein